MADEKFKQALFALASLLLTGCGPRPAPEAGGPGPAAFPEAYYQRARDEGHRVLAIAPERSLVTIMVRPGGVLAHVGHDHVVASRGLRGYVDVDRGRADIRVPLDELTVDEPELRARAGIEKAVSPEAALGTRRNMRDKVLETARFPFALIHVAGTPSIPAARLQVDLTLHGISRRFDLPVHIQPIDQGLLVSGRMAFRQTDFGMTPFAVLGGALQVQDELELDFQVAAVQGAQ